jgi:hypothetical protein
MRLLQVNRGFEMCPMLAKPNEIAMLSVKKKHPLGGSCDSRRRRRSRCTNLRQPLSVEGSCFPGYLLLIEHAAWNPRQCSPQSPLPITTTYLQRSNKPFGVPRTATCKARFLQPDPEEYPWSTRTMRASSYSFLRLLRSLDQPPRTGAFESWRPRTTW